MITPERVKELRELIRTGCLLVSGDVQPVSDLRAALDDYAMPKVVTREWIHQRAGLLSTMNFMGSHPEEALRWMLDLFREVGVKVED